MQKTIKFLGLALLGMLLITTGCKKETENVEEDLGLKFTVTTSDGDSWTTSSVNAKTENGKFVITATKDDKQVVLTIKEFAKGKYTFTDTLNYATYNPVKSDASKLYTSAISQDNYVEIQNIHSDNERFDGRFSFLATDKDMNVLTVSGSWINVAKQ